MREILFRARTKDTGEWVEGWYCMYPHGKWPCKHSIVPAQEAVDGHHRFIEVDPTTIGQFTGLLDKNGKRVFEGDVVRFVHPSPDVDNGIGVVLWNNDELAWEFRDPEPESLIWYNGYAGDMYEVIGTIHEPRGENDGET